MYPTSNFSNVTSAQALQAKTSSNPSKFDTIIQNSLEYLFMMNKTYYNQIKKHLFWLTF